jgi:hypothetical protein
LIYNFAIYHIVHFYSYFWRTGQSNMCWPVSLTSPDALECELACDAVRSALAPPRLVPPHGHDVRAPATPRAHLGALKVARPRVSPSHPAQRQALPVPPAVVLHAAWVPPCFKTWRTPPIKSPPACTRAHTGPPPHHCRAPRSAVRQGSHRWRNPLSPRANANQAP